MTSSTKAVFWKTPYNHDTNKESESCGLDCDEPSKTKQSDAKDADINEIVRRFGLTGQLPNIQLPPLLDEFSEVFDFQSAMDTMNAAKHSFMQLDPDVRNAFHNDPHRFVATIDAMLTTTDAKQREANINALRAMGLAVHAEAPADKTTLGDLLAAIKEGRGPGDQTPPQTPKEPPKGSK